MSHLKILFAITILLVRVECFSQQSLLSLGLWNISSLSGELKVGGLYGQGDINTYGIDNKIKTTNYYGGLLVNSNSYIWTPNFLTVSVDGGYYPESRQDLYLVSPNVYNAINTSKLHLGATLFPRKVITLSTYLNFDNSYDSRENLTDIRTNSKTYGGTFAYRSNFLPLTLAYNQSDWDSKEVLTGRDYRYKQNNIEGRLTKSFRKKDKNDLLYTHHDYTTQDYSLNSIRNVSDNLDLQDGFYLDSSRRSHYNSDVFGTVQRGTDSFKNLRVSENLFYQLPHHLTINGNYSYYYIEQMPERLQQNSFNALLGHQLFESLHSGILFEYNNALESSYHETTDKIGIDLSYTKKTFANGLLNIQYTYNREFEKRTSSDVLLQILNEQYTLSDRVLLKRPYIDQSTIVVKDVTGTIIYQQGLDYILTNIGDFTEIQRIPGGLIANNVSIYVFYTATQPGNYNYDINLNFLSFNYSIFNGFLDIYYRVNKTDFDNIHNADNLLLNYVTEYLSGASIKYKTATAGAEYDDYQSNLVPYTMMRYFLTWQSNIREKILFSVNANWRDYKIPTEITHREYGDLNGMVTYAFDTKSKIDFNVGYQSQTGQQINLNFVMARAKFTTLYRHLQFVVGVDYYDRVYLENQKTDYLGAYVQIIKKFKY